MNYLCSLTNKQNLVNEGISMPDLLKIH
jgi:hypothetical protein